MGNTADLDLALSVVCAITPYGHTWSSRDLAEICGCSKDTIFNIEKRGLKKLRKKFGVAHECANDVHEIGISPYYTIEQTTDYSCNLTANHPPD